MKKRRTTRLAAALLALGLIAAACGDDDSTATTGTAAPAAATQAKDVVDTAVAAGSFTVLVEAVKAAGLVDALKAPGPITVFAPTDEAFAAALKTLGLTKEQLLADKATLTAVLTYHVVSGKVKAADVVKLDGKSAETLNGKKIAISVRGGDVLLNGDTKVVTTDIETSNGVIHVVNKVLLPPA
jgi:transforming growth factor-beta-induced protein